MAGKPHSTQFPAPLMNMLSRVPQGPLNGVLVVAFDQQIAGSLAAEELARAGATVIKVEKPGGDPKRTNSTDTAFNTFNAGKMSVVFTDSPADQKLKRELLARADVIIDNRSAAAQKRDTVLQETLRVRKHDDKPQIFCSISGFGPGTEAPAYDRVVQAASGMADFNGRLIPFPLIDMATGKEAALEISKYLFRRERMTSAERKERPSIRLDISMAAVALNIMANPIATYLDTGKIESTIVPFNLYEARDGKLAIATATDGQFNMLCDVLGIEEMKKYRTNSLRQEHREEIEGAIAKVLVKKPIAHWVKTLSEKHLSVAPVVSLPEAVRRHGRDIIKPTREGGLMVAGPTECNAYPGNPRIGDSPKHPDSHQGHIAMFIEYLEENAHDPHALARAIGAASAAPEKAFEQKYRFVDANQIDFSREESDVPWAKGRFFSIRKTGHVNAELARPWETVPIKYNEVFIDNRVAMPGDWKITTNFGGQYLLSDEKFKRNYVPVEGKPGEYAPSPNLKPRKAIEVTDDVRFVTPDNDTVYIPKGGWIAQGSDGPYGIHLNSIENNYKRSEWVDRIANPGTLPKRRPRGWRGK